jgi:subtilase family serine protease
LRVEELEPYNLLSAVVPAPVAQPNLQASPTAAPAGQTATPLFTPPATNGGPYTPAQIQAAYGFTQLYSTTTSSGKPLTGTGETIAIVDAYNDPNIASDLATFDSSFGLAPLTPSATVGGSTPTFTVENESGQALGSTGGTGTAPSTNSGWALEISLDVEWAHAIAPGANILLVEANSSSFSDLFSAVGTAARQANVVSMSWGSNEFSGETSYDSTFAQFPNVTFVASAGDSGALYGPEYPAVSPYVLSVGGTSLSASTAGTYGGERGWGNSYYGNYAYGSYFFGGGGGGESSYEPLPSYQPGSVHVGSTLYTGITGRMSPDVAYDANPNSGVYIYDSVPYNGSSGWWQIGGTSAGAPQWSALVALADQDSGSPLGENAQAALYQIYTAKGPYTSTSYAADFNDVTSGSNGYAAGTGYDLVTGLGTPKANTLVPDLTKFSASSTSSASKTGSTGGTGGTGGSGTRHAVVIVLDVTQTAASQPATTTGTGTNNASQATGAATSRTTSATGLNSTANNLPPLFLTPAAGTPAVVTSPAPPVRTAALPPATLTGTTGLTTSSMTHYYAGSAAEGNDVVPEAQQQQPQQPAPQVAPEMVPESDDAPYSPDLAGDVRPDLIAAAFAPDGGVAAPPEAGSLPPVLLVGREGTLQSAAFAAALVFLGGAWKVPADVKEAENRRRVR